MVPSDYLVCSLATLMFNEPKEDSLLGFTACGLVVRNRVLAGWEGGNWLRLISKHDSYSASAFAKASADLSAPLRVLVFGDPHHDSIFRRCLGVAENIYAGREKDITEGALWYGRLDACSEGFKENIVRPTNLVTGLQEHAMVSKIGLQMFFQ